MRLSRRDFLKLSLCMGGGFLANMLLENNSYLHAQSAMAADIAQTPGYALPDWTGDNFLPMHRIRDHRIPPTVPAPSRFVDVVIVGGGLSGLATGFLLNNENMVILEREKTLGGNAKSGQYGDISYALGSAYLVDIEEPFASLYSALGLPLRPVPEPVDLRYAGGYWLGMDKTPDRNVQDTIQQEFLRLRGQFKKMLTQPDFPVIPLESASAQAMKLDRISFYEYLKEDYSPAFLRYIDAYCYSALGGGIQEISAYAGINFYSEIAGPIYAFPGGNAFVARRLAEKIQQSGSDRFITGVSVYHIEQRQDRVRIAYFDNDTGEAKTVEAKAAICAAPYLMTLRILKGVPDTLLQDLRQFDYGSYLVANCCFDQRVTPSGGYDHWLPGQSAFTDFIDAGYVSDIASKNKPSHPQVLTVYAPFRKAREGRFILLEGNKQPLAQAVVKGLKTTLSFPDEALKEIRLTRYGHQLLSSKTGIIQLARSLQKQQGRIFLAHSDGQGMASIESALSEAFRTAAAVRTSLRSLSYAVSVL